MNEAYVLLNVNYKLQNDIIKQARKITITKDVKKVYGLYDVLIIFESDDMQKIKNAIDIELNNLKGISNMISLISVI